MPRHSPFFSSPALPPRQPHQSVSSISLRKLSQHLDKAASLTHPTLYCFLMTHRPYSPTPHQPRIPPHSSHKALSSSKHTHAEPSSHLTPADMVKSHLVLHIVEILGVFVCAHHFWPKGVTYGEAEEWEIEHRKKNAHGSRSKSKNQQSRGPSNAGSSSDGVRRNRSKREERTRDYEYEYEERPRHSRHASSRY